MRSRFPTKDDLMTMPITFLRGLDIAEKDEELLVQEVLIARLEKIKPVNPLPYMNTDVKTKEEELAIQKRVDELRGRPYFEMEVVPAVEPEVPAEIPAEPVETPVETTEVPQEVVEKKDKKKNKNVKKK